MFGPPKDVDGECNARLYLGDDYGDNSCTIRCNLKEGHEGPHTECFKRNGNPVSILWVEDESMICKKCSKRDMVDNMNHGFCADCSQKYIDQGMNAFGATCLSPYSQGSYQDVLWKDGWFFAYKYKGVIY